MTIAFYCGSKSWGGLEMNMTKRALWLKERGHEVIFIGPAATPALEDAKQKGIEVKTCSKNAKYFAVRSAFQVYHHLKRSSVQHLIVSDPKDLSLSAWVSFFSRRKISTTYLQVMQIGINKKDLIHTIRFNRLDHWITVLPYLEQQLYQRTRIKKEKVLLIPAGIDINRFHPLPEKNKARQDLNLPEDAQIIGLLGRIDHQKGQQVLLEASIPVLSQNSNIHLAFMGEPTKGEGEEFYQSLLKQAQNSHLENQVHFLSFNPNVPLFFSAIDVFVMATKSETYGMVTVEAMVCGKTIIGSNSAGTKGLLEDGKWGHLFEPMNSKDLQRVLEGVMQKDRAFHQSDLQTYAKQHYSKDTECARIERLLEQWLNS